MTQNTGYQMTEQDIETAMRFLKAEGKSSARGDAVKYLEEKHAVAHMAAHKIVEDEKSGKIDPVKLKND
ncbi:hypothetical protein KJ707_02790 [Patescibacteria group bacterium]|nr:hypothetical protein [Patescibacteria group bacterium]